MVSSENKNKNAFFNNFSCLQFHKTTFLKFTLVNKSCKPVSFSFSASSLQFSTGRSGSIVKLGIGYYLYFCLGGGGGLAQPQLFNLTILSWCPWTTVTNFWVNIQLSLRNVVSQPELQLQHYNTELTQSNVLNCG